VGAVTALFERMHGSRLRHCCIWTEPTLAGLDRDNEDEEDEPWKKKKKGCRQCLMPLGPCCHFPRWLQAKGSLYPSVKTKIRNDGLLIWGCRLGPRWLVFRVFAFGRFSRVVPLLLKKTCFVEFSERSDLVPLMMWNKIESLMISSEIHFACQI
jgi:hypothetical protein